MHQGKHLFEIRIVANNKVNQYMEYDNESDYVTDYWTFSLKLYSKYTFAMKTWCETCHFLPS